MTQLITAITALDRTKETADQSTLKEIQSQRDAYKRAFHAYSEALQSLTLQKISLRERLFLPLNDRGPVSPTLNSNESSGPTSPVVTHHASLLTEIEELDERNDSLSQELIEKCSRQRDKYREGLYRLKDAVVICQQDIVGLENQLALSSIPKQPEVLTPKDSLSGSPTGAFSPTESQQMQIELLIQELAKVNRNVRISERDKESAIQNYIFMLFALAKKQRNEPIDLKKFDKKNLSKADQELLEQAAKTAAADMGLRSPLNYDLDKLFSSKSRNLDGKMKALASRRENGTIRTDSIEEITKLEGFAQKIFAHFFEKLRSMKPQKGQERNYEDFSFTTIAFLAGDLLFAEEIYEECRTSYEKLQAKYSQAHQLDRILYSLNQKIGQIKEVQRLFFALLQNSQVR